MEETTSGSFGPAIGEQTFVMNRTLRPKPCPDCGVMLGVVLKTFGKWVQAWVYEEHTCPEGEERKRREGEEAVRQAAEEAAAREAWLRDPPAERVREVVQRVGLPRWIRGGLDWILRERVDGAVLDRLYQHREVWLRGDRPERGLWLWSSDTGVRKTTLLSALAFDVNHRLDVACAFVPWERLLDEIRWEAAGAGDPVDFARIDGAAMLVLDDLPQRRITERGWELLSGLVKSAQDGWAADGEQVVYASANVDPGGLRRVLDGAREGSGKPIVRRLVQLCEVVEVRGRG